MADEAKIGTHWQDDELDAIVADYFAMLDAELIGWPASRVRAARQVSSRAASTWTAISASIAWIISWSAIARPNWRRAIA